MPGAQERAFPSPCLVTAAVVGAETEARGLNAEVGGFGT